MFDNLEDQIDSKYNPISPFMESKQNKDNIFEKEFLPHADALYNFAYMLVSNQNDANDLVQETYLKAYRFIDRYEEGTNSKSWLFRVLKNAFINQYRKSSREPSKTNFEEVLNVKNEEQGSQLSSFTDMRTEMFGHMMGDEVTRAINILPEDFRTVILLCDIEGFTYEEISKIIGIPIGTVRSRLHRARNELKTKLATYAKSMGFKTKV